MPKPVVVSKKPVHGALLRASTVDLRPRADLTFKVLDGVTLEGGDVHRSMINGSLIRNCEFRGVNLARSDLEQTQILNCTFVDVDFSNIELTSTVVDHSRLENCRFDDALLSDCSWRQSQIDRCSFRKAAIQSSVFEDCRLIRNDLQGASVQLNTFRRTRLERMVLGDCTFLNQLMVDCKFEQVHITIESIGSVFGLSEHDLLGFGLIYLGQPVLGMDAANGLLDGLETEYSDRQWVFMREILRLNFGRVPVVEGLNACFEALTWPSSLGIPLKANDILFLEMVLSEFFRRRQLPGLVALTFPDRIKRFLTEAAGGSGACKQDLRLQHLGSHLRVMLFEMLDDLNKSLDPLGANSEDRPVTAIIEFAAKPAIDVPNFMKGLAEASAFRVVGATVALRERYGSYELVLQTTLLTLVALRIGLWLVNGCAAQAIELKARVQIGSRKRLPKVIRERALLADQDVPKSIAVAVQGIASGLFGKGIALGQVAKDLSLKSLRKITVEDEKKSE